MTNKPAKSAVVAFKVEVELAEFLDKLPNKSDFIRRAIYERLGISCPLCNGTGNVDKETHDVFESFFGKWELHACLNCGDQIPFPKADSGSNPDSSEGNRDAGSPHASSLCLHCSSDSSTVPDAGVDGTN